MGHTCCGRRKRCNLNKDTRRLNPLSMKRRSGFTRVRRASFRGENLEQKLPRFGTSHTILIASGCRFFAPAHLLASVESICRPEAAPFPPPWRDYRGNRSEEHTSELQSR